jgi:hypothetical protein
VDEVPIEALREAIRNLHGCDSTFGEAVPVVEWFRRQTVWEGAAVTDHRRSP